MCTPYPVPRRTLGILTDAFLSLFCEKNSDGTKNLRLKGRDLWQRVGRRLDDQDMHEVAEYLVDHPEIIKLDLCYNDIGDEGVHILVDEYLCLDNNLQHLNLMSCSLGFKAMQFLFLTSDSLVLKTLRVNGNKLGTQGGQFLAYLLGNSSTLELLDVGDSDQTLGSLMHFLSMIRSDIGTNTSLKVIDLSRIIPSWMYYQYSPGHMAENLGIMLKVNTTLVELHAQKCEFDGHDIELLLIGMSKNKTLLLLDLGYNRMADHGIELLANWLKTRPGLLGLNVAGNNIGNTGARALSFGMPFSRVRLLDITHNRITDDGMIDILNSIKKPFLLRYFYFWGNKFGHNTNKILERMLLSQVLDPDNIDVRVYEVDKVLYTAFHPVNHYKHRYYCVMDHGCPVELRIKKNKLPHPYAQPRALFNLKYYDRFPAVDESLPPIAKPC